jgi:hypothetical protein
MMKLFRGFYTICIEPDKSLKNTLSRELPKRFATRVLGLGTSHMIATGPCADQIGQFSPATRHESTADLATIMLGSECGSESDRFGGLSQGERVWITHSVAPS